MKLTKITAYEHTIDRDGWSTVLEHTAWKDEEGRIWEHKLDRDGWPLEVLREDWKEKA